MSTYMDKEFDVLKGKKIISIDFPKTGRDEYSDLEDLDTEAIRFNLEHESYSFRAYGDCCSSSYIESLDNPEIFKNAVFESVESVNGESKDMNEYEVHKWTFYKFKTNKGMCTLSFRNESNGYYDGHLELIKDKK